MARLHGKGGAAKLVTVTGAKLIAAINEWSITSNADEVDATAFGDTDKYWLAGFKDGQIRLNGFYDPDSTEQSAMHSAFDAGSEVSLKLYVDANRGFEADAIVLGREVSAPVNGAVTCNFTLRANGAITEFNDAVS